MTVLRHAAVLLALVALGPRPVAWAACSSVALNDVLNEIRAAAAPDCAPRSLHRIFNRSRNRGATLTARATRECARGKAPRIAAAHNALSRILIKVNAAGLDPACAASFEEVVARLNADLSAAASGIGGTTTTSTTPPPGASTTTSVPSSGSTTTTLGGGCATVSLDVSKIDCTSVSSVPAGLVHCGSGCDEQIFVVPGDHPLRLRGSPAPGDVGVTFDGDCDDDGTVLLDQAFPPDCSLSCDCSSGF